MANASGSKKNKLNQELLTAVKAYDEKKVASCLKKGADPDTRDKTGDTLLNIALSNEKISPNIIELLVESGAHLNYVSSDRITPLMCAVYNINVPLETVGYLLQSGASIYSRDSYGQTPLLYATGREDIALVDLLLTYGASVNETDVDGNTLLFEAVRQGYENLFSYLVDQGADLTVRDYQGTTLLMAAIEQKQEKMAHFLLDFPEIDILDSRVDGLTVLDMIHDLLDANSLSDDAKYNWQLLADSVTSRINDRLSVFDELNEIYSEETDDDDFIEVKEDSEDDFGDFDLDETILSSESDEEFDDEDDVVFELESDEDELDDEDDVVFELESDEEGLDDEDDVVFELESDEDALDDEDDVVFELESNEEGLDDEDDVVFELESDEEGLDVEDDLPYMMSSEDELDDEDDVVFELESNEEGLDVEDDLPYMMSSEEELDDEDDVVFELESDEEGLDVEDDLPYMMSSEEELDDEDDLSYMMSSEEELDDEDDLSYMMSSEEELDDEEDLPYMMSSEEELDDEEDLSYVLDSEEESIEEEDDGFDFDFESGENTIAETSDENGSENRSYDPYETNNMDPWTYFETEKSRVVSQVIKVNPAEISTPLEADTVNHLPLYSREAYQHAEKMIKRYTEYQSEDGQKGVCLSGVYLTNKACSQARVHIERGLLEEGYAPKQAHEQSVVLLYKLIRANGLYHPKEFVLRENGEKSLALKVWGCDHRLLLKSLINEFAPEGDWYHSLHEIEKYVSEKGEGKLISAM